MAYLNLWQSFLLTEIGCDLNFAKDVWPNYNSVPFKIIAATVKYMTRPVTSTRVATKGADEAAGSTLSRFNMRGIIEPLKVPHITTPINAKNMVIATNHQCGP